jgi:hypothetical protein
MCSDECIADGFGWGSGFASEARGFFVVSKVGCGLFQLTGFQRKDGRCEFLICSSRFLSDELPNWPW